MLKFNLIKSLILWLYFVFQVYSIKECDLSNKEDAFADIKFQLFQNGTEVGKYAKYSINYYDTFKIIKNKNTAQTIGLYCKGTKKPEKERMKQTDNPDFWVEIPVTKVGSLSRSAIAMLEALNITDTLKAAKDLDSVTSPCAQNLIQNKQVKTINEEDLSANDVQITFADKEIIDSEEVAYKQEGVVTLSHHHPKMTPLHRAIWINYVAVFFNLERKAEELYNQISNTYKCYEHNVDPLENKNRIVVVKYDGTKNDFEKGSGKWNLIENQYWTDLITKAGGVPFYVDDEKIEHKNTETFLDTIKNTDAIIDLTEFPKGIEANLKTWKKIAGIDKNNQQSFKFIKNRQVFSFNKLANKLGSFDSKETMDIRADLLIADLINVQYPGYDKNYKPIWMSNLTSLEENSNEISSTQCPTAKDRNVSPIPAIVFDGKNGCTIIRDGYSKITADGPVIRRTNSDDEIEKSNLKSGGIGIGGIFGITFGILLLILFSIFIIWVIKKRRETGGKPLTIHRLKVLPKRNKYKETDELGLLEAQ